jgi:hypothetical protein
MAPTVNLFGPIDTILGAGVGFADVLVIEVVLLVLVVANFLTRMRAHAQHRSPTAPTRSPGFSHTKPRTS